VFKILTILEHTLYLLLPHLPISHPIQWLIINARPLYQYLNIPRPILFLRVIIVVDVGESYLYREVGLEMFEGWLVELRVLYGLLTFFTFHLVGLYSKCPVFLGFLFAGELLYLCSQCFCGVHHVVINLIQLRKLNTNLYFILIGTNLLIQWMILQRLSHNTTLKSQRRINIYHQIKHQYFR
jgi:hypothetical protein